MQIIWGDLCGGGVMLGSKDAFLDRTKLELSAMQMHHCGIQECEKGYMWQFHARPYHLLHFVLEGEGTLITAKEILKVHSGQAFFIPAGTNGKYIASLKNPWKYAWIGFYADNGNSFIDLLFGENEILNLEISKKELEKGILSIVSVMDKRIQDVAFYQEEDFPGNQFFSIRNFSASLEANSRMMHLFARLLETQGDCRKLTKKEKNLAKDAKNYMDCMYKKDIKIQDVARNLHVHPNYLSTLFRKEYGQSPREYLRKVRMNQAKILLSLTEYSIMDISFAVGYTNPFQFSKVFKNCYEVSPTQYRKLKKYNQLK